MTNPTPEDKAVALAERHRTVIFRPYEKSWAFTEKHLVAMLAERDKQRTDELAQGSGVMPFVRAGFRDWVDRDLYDSEAIATLQAREEQTAQEMADQGPYINKLRGQVVALRAELEQVREQTRRDVLEEAAKMCDLAKQKALSELEIRAVELLGTLAGRIRSLK